MRRLSLTLLAFVLLLSPTAAVARDQTAGDGSLVVTDALARQIVVQGNGLIYGHIDSGTLTVYGYDAADARAPQISGTVAKVTANWVRYSGADLRFLFPNGRYLLKFAGAGINISAVGRGTITAAGFGTGDDGTVAVNGNRAQKLGFTSSLALFGAAKETTTTTVAPSTGKATTGTTKETTTTTTTTVASTARVGTR